MNWSTQAQFYSIVEGKESRLIMIVQPFQQGWQVLALTTSLGTKTPEEVFDDHAHKIVGQYPYPVEAIEAAESFANAWVKKIKPTKSRRCECKEIAS